MLRGLVSRNAGSFGSFLHACVSVKKAKAIKLSNSVTEIRLHRHQFAGMAVASAWPLPELPSDRAPTSVRPTITISLLAAPPPNPGARDWIHHWPEELGAMSLGRIVEGNKFFLRFPGLADFVVAQNGSAVDVWRGPETTPETLRHLLLDQVLPRVVAQKGRLVLHAGAVRVGQEAIAFVGDTGRGKSTLTASFHAAGHSLLSDDGLELLPEESATRIRPTYPSLRLWPETVAGLFARQPDLAPMAHYSSKRRVILNSVESSAPLPLAALYVLTPDAQDDVDGISLTPLSPREACMTIVSNSFQLDVTDLRRATSLLTVASNIAQQLPVFSLAYPRNFAVLPDVRQAILNQHRQAPTKGSGGK